MESSGPTEGSGFTDGSGFTVGSGVTPGSGVVGGPGGVTGGSGGPTVGGGPPGMPGSVMPGFAGVFVVPSPSPRWLRTKLRQPSSVTNSASSCEKAALHSSDLPPVWESL
ncbi:MAG: hypothetical protein COV67_08315 [Nitrospinae bacterium CG11_big_fil_rev_8_21_14_0_20_56_8]|nr:MAG: hypothetical protein COV67_08315 [Nitrospinae bacterium CG11_big_fil_rev_8_21_14_0_20_56_8]